MPNVFPGVIIMNNNPEKRRLAVGRIVKGEIVEYKTARHCSGKDAPAPVPEDPEAGRNAAEEQGIDEKWIADWREATELKKKPWWKFWG
ncbi:MAG: hypothetical protein K6T80_02260 [Firmicutes bacterium]|nr:hypothetical protein [Bacillota bacterium]